MNKWFYGVRKLAFWGLYPATGYQGTNYHITINVFEISKIENGPEVEALKGKGVFQTEFGSNAAQPEP